MFAKTAALIALMLLSLAALANPNPPALAEKVVPQLRQVGAGEMRWFGLRLYQARLLAADGRYQDNAPYALEITYQREIERERLVDTSVDEIRRLGLDQGRMPQWREAMSRGLVDVKPGDQLLGVYLPGVGVRFYARSGLTAEIRDEKFAQAFFAIWLHPQTREPGLRRQLLGVDR
ncbi:MAG: hypothetical protein QG667_1218 [Pseudomonadota bacterium]|jgi:hypothetical protein|nr:hypothetical protein [Pseudomonadota bacterium]